MSDQDFFFDDEEVEESPKGGAKKSSPKGGSTKEPVKPTKPVANAATAEGVSFFEQAVPMQVVALVAVIALLLGVIGGFFLAPKPVSTPTTTLPASTGTGSMGTGSAPSLSEDQLNSGQMPAGHPDVSGESTATTTP